MPSPDFPCTIFHNPQCSTSRKALDLMRARGLQPEVVEYLKTPPDRDTLTGLIAASGRPVSDFVRSKEPVFATLGLGLGNQDVADARLGDAQRGDAQRGDAQRGDAQRGDAQRGDAQYIDALLEHPRLLERPIVVTPLGTRLGRPLEAILDILPSAP